MAKMFKKYIEGNKIDFLNFIHFMAKGEKQLLILGDIKRIYENFVNLIKIHNDELDNIIQFIQEALVTDNLVYVDVREVIGSPFFYRVNLEESLIEPITIKEYLISREHFIDPHHSNNILTLNFDPYYKSAPKVRDVNMIGKGVEYLNRFLSSQMFNDLNKWQELLFNFARVHKYNNQQLLINNRIENAEHLIQQINRVIKYLKTLDNNESYVNIRNKLQEHGFEIGLGSSAGEIIKSLEIFNGLLNNPDHIALMKFISGIPMIFKVLIISPHGYFGQDGVLGLPDTGGQIVYILDQVKALEKSLAESIKNAGLDVSPKIIVLTRLIPNAGETKNSQRLEKIYNTHNSWILRVPFREHNPKVTNNWISRFQIWPYLEEFAEDSYIAIQGEFQGRPDLIIGNYSDGNLIAYLLAKRFNVTQCCIAHALEKSKYLFSALYWKQLENHYHFSLQFTADLIAMNSSDFQITSTFQEIAGTENSVGQYESYKHFTMPGFYRVENGINIYHTKFNVLSPGVNENIYFPFTEKNKRLNEIERRLKKLVFEDQKDSNSVGGLADPNLIPIFSMARLDKNKNLTSLVKWFGKNEEIRKLSNLIVVAGIVDSSKSKDREEIEEINLMHNLIDKYNLHQQIRWIGTLFPKHEAGELYRIIADRHGVFVQPGLFEGFGLTVLESMISGLPVIATKYGGPLEIIQHGMNGFHIDPVEELQSSTVILDFLKKTSDDKGYWDKISQAGIKRVNEVYNWKLFSDRLLSLSKIYGFWRYAYDLENEAMKSYLELIYYTIFKPRAEGLLAEHNQIQ